ncbi:M-phase-specific PLK1-interacting protein [Osmerus eperlanus]|uniref:M-phase-specific PLK1-interacting protein n=1 Tax=Osmerus eperlanus TaxID=29151 RepID=UPI002E0F7E78
MMYRPNFRQQSPGVGSRRGGFRNSTPTGDNGAGALQDAFPSPAWAFRGGPPPSFGSPRYGQFDSPNNTQRHFGGNAGGCYGGSDGKMKYDNSASPGHTPRRWNPNQQGGSPYRNSSPRRFMEYGNSPRNSSPFGSTHGRGKGADGVEKYYSPTMLQDPWAILQPVAVTDSKCQQSTNTGKPGRYY